MWFQSSKSLRTLALLDTWNMTLCEITTKHTNDCEFKSTSSLELIIKFVHNWIYLTFATSGLVRCTWGGGGVPRRNITSSHIRQTKNVFTALKPSDPEIWCEHMYLIISLSNFDYEIIKFKCIMEWGPFLSVNFYKLGSCLQKKYLKVQKWKQ